MTATSVSHPGSRTRERGELVKLGRYRTPAGERWLVGRRVDSIGIVDTPAPGVPGRSYLIEKNLRSRSELLALLADYLRDSRTYGKPAMFRTPVGQALDEIAALLGV